MWWALGGRVGVGVLLLLLLLLLQGRGAWLTSTGSEQMLS